MPALDRRIGAERARIVRFLITGLTGASLNVGIFALFARGLDVDYRVAVVLAFGLSYGFTFIAHRYWTFEAADDHAGRQGLRFVVVSAVSTGWALVLTVIAVEIIGLRQNVSEAAAAVLAAPISFVLHRNHTFQSSSRTEPQPGRRSGGRGAPASVDQQRDPDDRQDQPVPPLHPQRGFEPEAAAQRL